MRLRLVLIAWRNDSLTNVTHGIHAWTLRFEPVDPTVSSLFCKALGAPEPDSDFSEER